jgi:hypothetical protein
LLYLGLDLIRKSVDLCLISREGELIDQFRAPADRDGPYGLARRVAVYDEPVRGVIESMNDTRSYNDNVASTRESILVRQDGGEAPCGPSRPPLSRTGYVDFYVTAFLRSPLDVNVQPALGIGVADMSMTRRRRRLGRTRGRKGGCQHQHRPGHFHQ